MGRRVLGSRLKGYDHQSWRMKSKNNGTDMESVFM